MDSILDYSMSAHQPRWLSIAMQQAASRRARAPIIWTLASAMQRMYSASGAKQSSGEGQTAHVAV